MRYAILLAVVIIQICGGGLYSWSSFVPYLTKNYGLSTAQTQIIFGGLIAVFSISMVYAGRLLKRKTPLFVAGIGGILFGIGYLIGSFSSGNFWLLILGLSVIGGIGTGFCYVCAISLGVKWFPEHKGLVTGVSVMGFGGGAIIMSFVAVSLFGKGFDVLEIFRLTGIVYGLLMFVSAMILRNPPTVSVNTAKDTTNIKKLVFDPFFISCFLGLFSGTFAGLMVIGNLKPIALSNGISIALAATGISVLALGNASGRILWGYITDKAGRRAIPASLLLLLLSLFLLGLSGSSGLLFIVSSFFVGLGFGGCFVVYAAMVASRFGADRVGFIYPYVFLAYGLSGITGPWTGGFLHDISGGYTFSIMASFLIVLAGLFLTHFFLKASDKKMSTENL